MLRGNTRHCYEQQVWIYLEVHAQWHHGWPDGSSRYGDAVDGGGQSQQQQRHGSCTRTAATAIPAETGQSDIAQSSA